MLIQACVNGSRLPHEHRAIPTSAAEIAKDAATVVRAGAGAIHVHPRRRDHSESIAARDVAAVCNAVRSVCPGVPVGVTTAAWIEPDLARRLDAIGAWSVLPDYASVNLSEEGAIDIIDLLNERGVGVEAGVWTLDDARLLIDEGLDAACLRILVEVEAVDAAEEAVTLAAAIDFVLDDGLAQSPRLHHGAGAATWQVIEEAMERGHDVRIGLEDTLVGSDGLLIESNAALVAQVADLAARVGRVAERI
jgi:uncharacterized protein (DUF849 family)